MTDYDLNDFEKLSQKYWELEMDADRFGKEMIAKLVIKLEIPIEVAEKQFKLSPYVEHYPSSSKVVISQLRLIVNMIKEIKKSTKQNFLTYGFNSKADFIPTNLVYKNMKILNL